MIISFISLDEGVSSKALLKDNMGRDPFKQLPDKFNSSLPSSKLCNGSTLYALLLASSNGCGNGTILKM
jgi:hypothetical protein